ncbi:MAG: NAD(P)/FAD-dependent oxidoreductase [bacterium]
MDIKDVVVIGAGPAGIATAIQLKRSNIEPVLLEQGEIGGLLRNANLVENYPGFPEGISGPDLVELFEKHLENTGVRVNFERALELEYRERAFFIKTNRRMIRSTIVVIATGTRPRTIPALSILDDMKERIFYEIDPIGGIKNKRIAIIGAGDAAFDYALNLSQKNEVIILNRRKQAECIPVLEERSMKSENISCLHNVNVDINSEDNKILLTCIDCDSQNATKICTDYVVIAIGREPCLDFLGEEIKKCFENLIKTNLLYMVGDIRNEIYRQTAICVGDGIKAAMKIYKLASEAQRQGDR